MSNSKDKKTFKIALAGSLLALATVCAYLAGALPINNLSFLSIVSIITGIMVYETGVKNTFVYVLTGLGTGFLVLVGKPEFFLYGLFFLPYGLIRYVSNKMSAVVGFVIRLIYFNLLTYTFLFVFQLLVLDMSRVLKLFENNQTLAWITVIVGGNLTFCIFDWVYGKFMLLYVNKIRNKLFKNGGEVT